MTSTNISILLQYICELPYICVCLCMYVCILTLNQRHHPPQLKITLVELTGEIINETCNNPLCLCLWVCPTIPYHKAPQLFLTLIVSVEYSRTKLCIQQAVKSQHNQHSLLTHAEIYALKYVFRKRIPWHKWAKQLEYAERSTDEYGRYMACNALPTDLDT